MVPDALGAEFTCCALDSSGIAASASYNGLQVFTDPLFCGPAAWQTAPTESGDYDLSAASPCLAATSPCGERIGARDQACATTGVGDDPAGPGPPVLAVYPNPFTGSLHVSFHAPGDAARATVELFDLQGRLLWSREVSAATGDVEWDGRDASGRRTSPGVYFVHIRAGSMTKATRVVRVH